MAWRGQGWQNDGSNVNQRWNAGELETTIEIDMLSGDGQDMSEQGRWVFIAFSGDMQKFRT